MQLQHRARSTPSWCAGSALASVVRRFHCLRLFRHELDEWTEVHVDDVRHEQNTAPDARLAVVQSKRVHKNGRPMMSGNTVTMMNEYQGETAVRKANIVRRGGHRLLVVQQTLESAYGSQRNSSHRQGTTT